MKVVQNGVFIFTNRYGKYITRQLFIITIGIYYMKNIRNSQENISISHTADLKRYHERNSDILMRKANNSLEFSSFRVQSSINAGR